MREVTRERVTNYTYWDYQKLRFPRNEGMRIDFVYASPALAGRVTGAAIDRDERKGKGASDHVPRHRRGQLRPRAATGILTGRRARGRCSDAGDLRLQPTKDNQESSQIIP